MSELEYLDPSVFLTRIAEEHNVSKTLINRILWSIVKAGLARPVANWLTQEEQRMSNERVRKAETAERFRRTPR